MRMPTVLIPIAMLSLAFPATAQELPRLLFCMGQCFGVAKNGDRIPVTKGTELAPGLRLETGPNSYAQVKFGPDNAGGIGENARVRFESRPGERDVVFLDQGRIRMIGGELIGRPGTAPVELRTVEGTIVLRSADIEVKTLPKTVDAQPALTLVKLNVGDARLGDLPVSRDVVQGIAGGKILDRAIPIGDIALPVPSGPGGVADRTVKPPLLALPVTGLKPVVGPVFLPPPIVSPALPKLLDPIFSPPPYTPLMPIVPSYDRILTQEVTTSTGTTSLSTLATDIQKSPTNTLVTAPLKESLTIRTFTLQ